jgi:predicted dithiol-disulfide oxidoreductase (DUF899 family)
MTTLDQPEAAPPVVDRAAFDAALGVQVAAEKDVTRHGDRASASRRQLPMVEVEDYAFTGPTARSGSPSCSPGRTCCSCRT